MISAKIVADNINEFGNRITTMLVTMPRIILAEFNTHRMFSRNSASSRAIPFEKMVKSVEENPFIPIAWQKDHKGMQGNEYLNADADEGLVVREWLDARDNAVMIAKSLAYDRVTKQLCNRLLEPFMWHTVIVTATEWENFFALRCPRYESPHIHQGVYRSKKDGIKGGLASSTANWFIINKGQAEIHMMALAEAMWDAYNESTPKLLQADEWHIPFESNISFNTIHEGEPATFIPGIMDCVKVATVMAARTSYTVVGEDQKPLTFERMIEIHDMMLNANPKHMSPFEHCAKAMDSYEYRSAQATLAAQTKRDITDYSCGWSGNLRGFIQYRKMIPNENITK